mgnify:CR=1 FL=1
MSSSIQFPSDATERALIAVLANWHIAGCLQELRRAG